MTEYGPGRKATGGAGRIGWVVTRRAAGSRRQAREGSLGRQAGRRRDVQRRGALGPRGPVPGAAGREPRWATRARARGLRARGPRAGATRASGWRLRARGPRAGAKGARARGLRARGRRGLVPGGSQARAHGLGGHGLRGMRGARAQGDGLGGRQGPRARARGLTGGTRVRARTRRCDGSGPRWAIRRPRGAGGGVACARSSLGHSSGSGLLVSHGATPSRTSGSARPAPGRQSMAATTGPCRALLGMGRSAARRPYQ